MTAAIAEMITQAVSRALPSTAGTMNVIRTKNPTAMTMTLTHFLSSTLTMILAQRPVTAVVFLGFLPDSLAIM